MGCGVQWGHRVDKERNKPTAFLNSLLEGVTEHCSDPGKVSTRYAERLLLEVCSALS